MNFIELLITTLVTALLFIIIMFIVIGIIFNIVYSFRNAIKANNKPIQKTNEEIGLDSMFGTCKSCNPRCDYRCTCPHSGRFKNKGD